MNLRRAIFLRVAGLLTILIVTICVTMALCAVSEHRRRVREDLLLDVKFLAQKSEELVLWDDRVALKDLLEKLIGAHVIIEYACIDRHATAYVRASRSSQTEIPSPPGLLPAGGPHFTEFHTSQGRTVWNVAAPVGSTRAVARIGVLQSDIDREVLMQLRGLAATGLAVILAGALLAGVIARRITREVDGLTQSLAENEQMFRGITERSFEIIYTLDNEGRFTYVSPGMEQVLGYVAKDVLGSPFSAFSPDSECEKRTEALQRVFRGECVQRLETDAIRRDGVLASLEINLSPIFCEERVVGVQGIARDTTDRKKAESQLRQYKNHLEQLVVDRTRELSNLNHALEEDVEQRKRVEADLVVAKTMAETATRAKSEFLANMSHEIRTPMTAILGYADFLLTEEGIERAPPHRREALETITRNGEHLLGLINDILDLSKVESAKMEIQRVRCSPFALLAEVVSLMCVRAEAKALKLYTETVGALPETVFTDPLRLRQVLVNLMGNAIRFTDQGEVRIITRLVSGDGPLRLRFEVTDTGIGMNEEQMAKLFQPFSQVDTSASRKFGGTGLGLAISKRLVEALGGAIEVRSTPGKGSTFSVTIDPGPLEGISLVHEAEATAGPSVPALTPAAAGAITLHVRVLLAEDGPDNQRFISFLLKKAGAEVTAVENGQLALEAALAQSEAGNPFHVILMDMQMPVMDGYEATRALRGRGYAGPIIALTAYAMVADRQKCLDAGCDDYTTKPIGRQRLLEVVAQWAARATSARDSRLSQSPLA